MLVPDVQSPEFFDYPVAYPQHDRVPETALDILHYISELQTGFGSSRSFVLPCLAFNQAMEELRPAAGHVFADGDKTSDQPALAQTIMQDGKEQKVRLPLYQIWVAQRAQEYFQSLSPTDQGGVLQMLGGGQWALAELVQIPVSTKLERAKLEGPSRFRMAVAGTSMARL